jgi:dihydropteroate synthase
VFPRRLFDVPLPDGRTLRLGERTLVMGILNVTPDSFADGGRHVDPGRAVDRALAMEAAGADLVDVGGESTRPGAERLPADEEIRRVEPVLRALAGRLRVPISIDTYKAAVAEAALDLGAVVVNDISALGYDPALTGVIVRRRAAVVLMHTRGRPEDMYREAQYADVVAEVGAELRARAEAACAAGIPPERLLVDPGIGFAKRPEHSGAILARIQELAPLGFPLLVGPSRKSFLGRATGAREPAGREWATATAVTAAVLGGAHVVRVHGVEAMADVVRVADMLRRDAGLDASGTGPALTGPYRAPGTAARGTLAP